MAENNREDGGHCAIRLSRAATPMPSRTSSVATLPIQATGTSGERSSDSDQSASVRGNQSGRVGATLGGDPVASVALGRRSGRGWGGAG